jgi:hypothetical protein
LQLGAPPVETILLEDILATVTSQTAIIKMDVQGYECMQGTSAKSVIDGAEKMLIHKGGFATVTSLNSV